MTMKIRNSVILLGMALGITPVCAQGASAPFQPGIAQDAHKILDHAEKLGYGTESYELRSLDGNEPPLTKRVDWEAPMRNNEKLKY